MLSSRREPAGKLERVITLWAVPGSNQRPSRCRRDALNQLS